MWRRHKILQGFMALNKLENKRIQKRLVDSTVGCVICLVTLKDGEWDDKFADFVDIFL